jgi:deazaflavin-dependent oxidoreductase (nitroreductase family)
MEIHFNIHRWLYRGQRPNWIAKLLNRLDAAVYGLGFATNYLATLEVVGRKSGKTISLPIAVTVVDGQRYLVSMLGEDVQWVQNVRANKGTAVLRSGGRKQVSLIDVPTNQRAPIIKAYLQKALGARAHFLVSKDAPLAEFEKIAADYPVFHIVSVP